MKQISKSALCLMVIIVLTLSFTACGNNTSKSTSSETVSSSSAATETSQQTTTEAKKEIVKLNMLTTVDWYKAGWEAVVKDIQANAEKNGFTLEVEKVAGGTDGEAAVKARFASGELPDALHWFGTIWSKINLGGLKNFTDLSGMPWIQNFDDKIIKGPQYYDEGKVYGVPFGATNLPGMYYNKKVFSDLGLQIPNTWADLLAACKTIKAAGKIPVYYAGKDSWTLQIIPIVGFNRFFKDKSQNEWFDMLNTNKAKWSDNTFYADSFNKLKELKDKGFINKNFLTDTYADGEKALADGTVAMIPNATWMIDEMATKYADKMNDIGGFAIPFDGNDYVVSFNPGPVMLTSACKNIDAGKAFMNYLGSKETQQIYFDAQPGVPMIKGVNVAAIPSANQDLYAIFSSGRGIGNWQDFAKFDIGYDLPKSCQDILVGSKTPDQLMKTMDESYARDAKNKNDPNFQ